MTITRRKRTISKQEDIESSVMRRRDEKEGRERLNNGVYHPEGCKQPLHISKRPN